MYNSCLFNLLGLELNDKSIEEQTKLLAHLNLLPFKCRLLFRLSVFYYKILDNQILSFIKNDLVLVQNSFNLRSKTRNIFKEPVCNTKKCSRRLSLFVPNFCNKVIRHSYNLSFSDFKTFLFFNIENLYKKIETKFLPIT